MELLDVLYIRVAERRIDPRMAQSMMDLFRGHWGKPRGEDRGREGGRHSGKAFPCTALEKETERERERERVRMKERERERVFFVIAFVNGVQMRHKFFFLGALCVKFSHEVTLRAFDVVDVERISTQSTLHIPSGDYCR